MTKLDSVQSIVVDHIEYQQLRIFEVTNDSCLTTWASGAWDCGANGSQGPPSALRKRLLTIGTGHHKFRRIQNHLKGFKRSSPLSECCKPTKLMSSIHLYLPSLSGAKSALAQSGASCALSNQRGRIGCTQNGSAYTPTQ